MPSTKEGEKGWSGEAKERSFRKLETEWNEKEGIKRGLYIGGGGR